MGLILPKGLKQPPRPTRSQQVKQLEAACEEYRVYLTRARNALKYALTVLDINKLNTPYHQKEMEKLLRGDTDGSNNGIVRFKKRNHFLV